MINWILFKQKAHSWYIIKNVFVKNSEIFSNKFLLLLLHKYISLSSYIIIAFIILFK